MDREELQNKLQLLAQLSGGGVCEKPIGTFVKNGKRVNYQMGRVSDFNTTKLYEKINNDVVQSGKILLVKKDTVSPFIKKEGYSVFYTLI